MNYGLYLSASGMLSNMYRQDVFANNLANAQTVGFKLDRPSIRQREPEAMEDNLGYAVSQQMLDKLGGGVLAGTQHVQHDRAAFSETKNPFDMALDEAGTFFAVSVSDGQGGTQVQLTRDGRFTRDSEGFLATMTGGYRVLDEKDKQISMPAEGAIHVRDDGQVSVNGEAVGKIQVTGVSDLERLIKQGQNLFAWEGSQDIRTPASRIAVSQGYTEQSSVDPISTLMQLIDATKTANSNANLIRYQDQMLDRVINTLGSVA